MNAAAMQQANPIKIAILAMGGQGGEGGGRELGLFAAPQVEWAMREGREGNGFDHGDGPEMWGRYAPSAGDGTGRVLASSAGIREA